LVLDEESEKNGPGINGTADHQDSNSGSPELLNLLTLKSEK
jgi:hypothetical protein